MKPSTEGEDGANSEAISSGGTGTTHDSRETSTMMETPPEEASCQPSNASIATEIPTEILIEIFMHLMFDCVANMSGRWISVSHVCSRWRDVALQCPQLWSWPSFRKIPCADAMIARAQHLPLHIVINLNKFSKSSGLWKAFASLTRAESFSMQGFLLPSHWSFFRKHIQGRALSAPTLRSLFMKVSDRHYNPYSRRRLSHGFSFVAPELRHLTIHAWGLSGSPVNLESCTRLTSLEIKATGGVTKLQDSMSDILNNLRHLQQLEELRLFHAFRHGLYIRDRTESGLIEVCLPALKVIEVHDKPQACRVFFESITYPDRGVRVSVNCIESIDDPLQDEAIEEIRELLRNTSRRIADPIRTLHINPLAQSFGTAKHPFSFNFWTLSPGPEIDYVDTPATLSVFAPFVPNLFEGICDTLPLRHLEHFVYSLDRSHNSMWRDIGSLENVWLLHITCAHYPLFKTLMAPWGAQLESPVSKQSAEAKQGPSIFDQPPQYFKALRDLSLNDWRFENFRHPWIDTHVLAKGLAKRREHGYPVSNLQIWGCGGFMYEDMEELVKVVDEVYWDEDDLIEGMTQVVLDDEEIEYVLKNP